MVQFVFMMMVSQTPEAICTHLFFSVNQTWCNRTSAVHL